MNDKPSDGARDNDINQLRFSRTQSFFDKSLTIRLFLGLFFAVVLFALLHFREMPVETLDLGSDAKRYVVSQIEFSFPDEEAMIILKQEAAESIGTIYRIEDAQIGRRATAFQKYITQSNEGVEQWEKVSAENDFDDVALVLSLLADGLAESRFTDIRSIQEIEQLPNDKLPIPARYFYPYLPKEKEGRLPPNFWSSFGRLQFAGQKIPQQVTHFILSYFGAQTWNFDVDQGAEYTLRKLTQAKIPMKYTRVREGERLIDKGEHISARHVTMLQAMKEQLNQRRNLLNPVTIVGSFVMTMLFVVISVIYLYRNHPRIYRSNRKLFLLVTILVVGMVLGKLVELFLLTGTSHLVDFVSFPLLVPFVAILLGSLMSARIAGFATGFMALIFALSLAVKPVPFMVINILTSIVAILVSQTIRRRKEIFFVCAKAWIASALIVLAFNLYENTVFSFIFIEDLISTALFMAVTGILVVGLIPVLESLFQIITNISLMEFMDPSNELLQRLTVEAPGTYQHSIVVGHLAEAAATAIGANGLFCRVATQYHDVGKMANPQYFTENQMGQMDMHQLLTPIESAQVVIAHVREGVALARKVGLPEQFIDIIKEHHGTTLVCYFYHKQLELMGSDKSKVSPIDFRYSGPRPRTKESTIIMIADTLEAASRSLDLFNEETVTDLVDTLIAQKMEDGQFNDSLLTFEELGVVKQTIIKTLLAASHPRIKYPPHHPGEEG